MVYVDPELPHCILDMENVMKQKSQAPRTRRRARRPKTLHDEHAYLIKLAMNLQCAFIAAASYLSPREANELGEKMEAAKLDKQLIFDSLVASGL